jgi:stage II sporulation protein D
MTGRGISPIGLAALVLIAAAGCVPGEVGGPVLPARLEGLPTAEPTLRVGIVVDTTSVNVTATRAFDVRTAESVLAHASAGRVWTFRSDREGRVEGVSEDGERTGWQSMPIRIITADGGTVRIGERDYRGEVLVLPRPESRVTAVNVVDLELYLLGVVPREMGTRPASEIEALKAQAVAARTYAIGHLRERESLGFDVYATVLDQVYGGVVDEDSVVSRAVYDTRGVILTHAGAPILAYYASTCGGHTASIEDSWPWRAPLPYLRGVSDMVPGSDRAYCDTSSRYRWTTRWTRDELLAVLAQTLPLHTRNEVVGANSVEDVRIVSVNRSARATVELTVDGRSYTLRADSVRWVLRPQPGPAILNSSRLDAIEVVRSGRTVGEVEARGGGWGHAIGMCQVGAMGRARAGHGYADILRAYYTGAQLTRLY